MTTRTPDTAPSTDAVGDGAVAFLSALVRNRHLLWRFPLLLTVVVVGISFLFPNIYRSTVTILPPENDFQSMGQSTGGLKSLFAAEMALPMMATPSDVLGEVLKSRTVRDSVIGRLDLAERWEMAPTKASTELNGITAVDVTDVGIIMVSVTSPDRFFADTLANTLVDAADRLNQSIANTKARRTREFVESRLVDTEGSLTRAGEALERFQNEHRTVALDVEIAALVENAAEIRARMTSDEIELSILEATMSPGHPKILSLRTRIAQVSQKLRELEEPGAGDSAGSFLAMGLRELPGLAQELAIKLRDVRVAETLYELLIQQYENARIQERKNTPTFSVLDWATSGGGKDRPKRLFLSILVLLSSFGFVVLYILAREYLTRLEQTDPERYRSLLALWQTIRSPRGQKQQVKVQQ